MSLPKTWRYCIAWLSSPAKLGLATCDTTQGLWPPRQRKVSKSVGVAQSSDHLEPVAPTTATLTARTQPAAAQLRRRELFACLATVNVLCTACGPPHF